MMNRPGKYFLYIVYAVAALFFFLVLLFPLETLKSALLEQVTDIQPDLDAQVQTVELVFPPGVKLTPFTVAYTGIPVLHIDQLKIKPHLFSLLSTVKKFTVSGEIGSGAIEGWAELIHADNQPQTKISMNLMNIPIEMVEVVKRWPQYQASGNINGFIDFDSTRSGTGATNVNLNLAGLGLAMNPPLMGLEGLEFSKLEAEIAVTPRMMQIKRCEATGLQLEGRLTGSIIFRQPIGNSRLTLSCMLKPLPAFLAEHKNDMIGGFLSSPAVQKRGMVFRISGTLDHPNYVMR